MLNLFNIDRLLTKSFTQIFKERYKRKESHKNAQIKFKSTQRRSVFTKTGNGQKSPETI